MRTRTRLSLAGVVLGVALIGGIAWATIPAADGTIQGCYSKIGGILRVVDSAGQCNTKYETAISWNQKGVPGAAGVNGTNGSNGAPGSRGATGATGATGARGPTGSKGDPGTAGTNGSNGAPGGSGGPGPQGPTGPAGSGLPPGYWAEHYGIQYLGQGTIAQAAWTTVLSKVLPAGQYIATFMVDIQNLNAGLGGNNSRGIECRVAMSGVPTDDFDMARINVAGPEVAGVALTWPSALDLSVQRTVTIECEVRGGGYGAPGTPDSNVQVQRTRLVAVRVAGLN